MMLQRAASNAYSWWWASHIRTKQSKWLEQNLQDMEEKVHTTLKLIEEDGDSFAKRAEMYYKKRPELINFVEESYRAYRALAERYDHISTELQNANNTLASVFPDQVQFSMDDDDDDSPRRPPEMMRPDVPKVPKAPTKDLKSILSSGAKKLRQQKKPKKKAFQIPVTTSKSGLSKQEGVQKIDKLQKDILSLQTAKEFVKSSYEGGLAKYWEIEKQINDLQGEVSVLQDEFSETLVIEDDEARSLMTATALRSCEETLIVLQEKQNKSAEAAKLEQMRIEEARQRFESLKKEILPGQAGDGEPSRVSLEGRQERETQELVLLEEKIKEQFQISLNSSMTVTEMAEKIDELVNKVISLETAVASQDGLIARLKGETDDLHALIKVLESDKTGLAKGSGNVEAKMKEMERKFNGVEDLTRRVKEQSIDLHTHFTEAQCNLEHLSEKVQCVKSDDEPEVVSLPKEGGYLNEAKRLVGLKVDGYDHSAGDKDSKRKTSNSEKERTQEKQKVSDSAGKVNESLAEAESSAEAKAKAKAKAKESKGSKVEEDEPTVADNSAKLKTNDSGKQDKKQKASSGSSMKKDDSFPVTRSLEVPQQQREAPTSSNDPAKVLSRTIEPVIAATATSSEQQTGPIPREICNESNQVKSQQKEIGAVEPSISTSAMNVQEKSAPKKLTDMPEPHLQHTEVNEDSPQQILSGSSSQTEAEKQEMEQEEPNWRELFLKGMEEREKTLLSEYTTTLRNYKDVKKKLHEVEKKTETTVQLRELKTANAMKDEEIRSLREKLSHLQTVLGHNKEHKSSDSLNVRDRGPVSSEKDSFTAPQRKEPDVDEDEDDINVMMVDQSEPISEIEEKLRMDIDQLLEENLDFWLRFSAALNQIQKYETSVEDLRSEISKLEEKAKKTEGSSHRSKPVNLKSDLKPLYKHLSEIQNELAVWMDKCGMLKEEQQSRFSSLCNIQEEITKAVKSSAEDEDFRFTSYQAAKFQGEVLNMKQENHKVADELQAGLDHITVLQIDVDRTLTRLNEEFEFSVSKSQQNPQLNHSASRARVPLRSFIFGVKPKKHRPSIFTCMTPAMHRKYNGLRVGF